MFTIARRRAAHVAVLAALAFGAPTLAHPGTAPAPDGAVHTIANSRTLIARLQARLVVGPDDLAALARLGAEQLAVARRSAQHADLLDAEHTYLRMLELEPNHAGAWRGLAYSRLGRHRFTDALDAARRFAELRPDDPSGWALLGDVHFALGHAAEAEAFFGRYLDAGLMLQSLARMGMMHQYRGRLEDADRAYHDALDAGRLLDAAPADLAWMHTITGELDLDGWGDLDGAASHFLAALSLDPDAAHATIGLAEIDLRRARPDAARDRLLALVDHHDSPRAWITLGRALQATGDDAAATRWFDRAETVMVAEVDAGEIGHVRELVDLWTRLGREPERCVRLALADLEEVRQDSAAYVTVARALHSAGRSDEAATYMDRALGMGGVDARVLWRAGRVFAAAGRDLPARRTEALAFRHPGALESTMTLSKEG